MTPPKNTACMHNKNALPILQNQLHVLKSCQCQIYSLLITNYLTYTKFHISPQRFSGTGKQFRNVIHSQTQKRQVTSVNDDLLHKWQTWKSWKSFKTNPKFKSSVCLVKHKDNSYKERNAICMNLSDLSWKVAATRVPQGSITIQAKKWSFKCWLRFCTALDHNGIATKAKPNSNMHHSRKSLRFQKLALEALKMV